MTPADWTKPPLIYQAFLGGLIISSIAFILISLVIKLLSLRFATLRQRPTIITTFCLILFLTLIPTPHTFTQLTIQKILDNPFILIGPPLTLLWMIGLWDMKKWSVIGFTAEITVAQLFTLFRGQWTPFNLLAFILPLIVLPYYSKMK